MKISEKTTVPLFTVLLAIPSFIGGIGWLTAISFKTDSALAENVKQDGKLDDQAKLLKNIESIVIRIEAKLEHQKGR